MAAPVFNETYGSDVNTQLLVPVREYQRVFIQAVNNTNVNVKTPTRIVNNTAGAGFIAYLLDDDVAPNYVIEYFTAGQEKMRRPRVIASTANGTTIAEVLVLGV